MEFQNTQAIFLRFPFASGYKYLCCGDHGMGYERLHVIISSLLENEDFLLYHNGKKMSPGQHVEPDTTIYVSFTLPGGKGGFGSMLRAIGAQIEKTTNREACRDLSGRRLRDINEEQRLKKWISKKTEREAEKERRRRERIERLKSQPKHNFVDFEYEKKISNLPERIDDALTVGVEKANKRSIDIAEPSTSSKKKCLWLDEDISSSSGSDNELEKSFSEGKFSNSTSENLSAYPLSEASGSSSDIDNSCKFKDSDETSVSCEQESSVPLPNNDNTCDFKALEEHSIDNVQESNLVPFCNENSCSSKSSEESVIESVKATSEVSYCERESLKETTDKNVVEALETSNDNSSNVNNSDETLIRKNQETFMENEIFPQSLMLSTSKISVEDKLLPGDPESGKSLPSSATISKDKDGDVSIDLDSYDSVSDLEALGLETLKLALMARSLKCGGNITDRAQRLWAVRGLKPEQYPKSLRMKPKKC